MTAVEQAHVTACSALRGDMPPNPLSLLAEEAKRAALIIPMESQAGGQLASANHKIHTLRSKGGS